MLSISQTSRREAELFIRLQAPAFPYSGGEAPGLWMGPGAASLGLRGHVGDGALAKVATLLEQDGLTSLAQEDTRLLSLNFVVPQSASVAWAIAPGHLQNGIDAAITTSAERTIAYLQEYATTPPRDRKSRQAMQLVAAAFPYGLGRAHGANIAPAPQRSVRCILFPEGPRGDGTVGRLDSASLLRQRMTAAAVFHASLAEELERLELHCSPDVDGFQIDGIPKSLCDYFSIRRTSAQRLSELGQDPVAQAAYAAITASRAKPSREQLLRLWRAEAAHFGVTPQSLSELVKASRDRAVSEEIPFDTKLESTATQGSPPKKSPENPKNKASAIVAKNAHTREAPSAASAGIADIPRKTGVLGAKEIVHRVSDAYGKLRQVIDAGTYSAALQARGAGANVTQQDVLRHVLDASIGTNVSVDALIRETDNWFQNPVNINSTITRQRATIERTQLDVAERIAALAADRSRRVVETVVKSVVAQAADKLDGRAKAAVRGLTQHSGRVTVIAQRCTPRRDAVLKAASESWRRAGYEVIGCASHRRDIASCADNPVVPGLPENTARLVMNWRGVLWHHTTQIARAAMNRPTVRLETLRLDQSQVLVVDRADTLSLKELSLLVRRAERNGGKLVLLTPGIDDIARTRTNPTAELLSQLARRNPTPQQDVASQPPPFSQLLCNKQLEMS